MPDQMSLSGCVATPLHASLCDWTECRRQYQPGRPGQRFCSARCRIAHYEHNHPRIGLPPVIPEGRSLDRLVALCADGRYRTIPEMAHETGTREATVARRIQESQSGRKGRAMARFIWDVRVRAHSKAKEYRLVLNPTATDPCPACGAPDGDDCSCEGCMHCGRIYAQPDYSGGPVCPEGQGCSVGDGRV